ncbi:MAG TPA: helix-turn-helix domain-containing protein [Actinomycetota bacterium]|nr:helix-turn-helix domain-containing protein [Actinomycetota bacterium]
MAAAENAARLWPPQGPVRRPALRAVPDDGQTASASDREMIEATGAAVELFAAKWKVDLLYLLAAGVRRHSRLHDHLLISKKVLSDALRALERDGLVQRRVVADRPVRVEYSLTPLGRSLTLPLFALYEWAVEHMDEVDSVRAGHAGGEADSPDSADALPRFKAEFQVA